MNKVREFAAIIKNYDTTLDLLEKTLINGGATNSALMVKDLKLAMHEEADYLIEKQEMQFESGKKKKCASCNGDGYTVEKKTIPKRNYPAGLPDSGWVTEEIDKNVKCTTCNGKGFLELKWV